MCVSICSGFLDSADMDAMLRRDPRELLQAARVRIFSELVLGMCPDEFERAVDQAYDISSVSAAFSTIGNLAVATNSKP
jgi:hypothetical protein